MNKKIKLAIIIIIFLIVFLLGTIVTRTISFKNDDNELFYDLSPDYVVKNCRSSVCNIPEDTKYDILTLSYNIDTLNEIVDKINNDTIKYYNKQKKSTVDDSTCSSVKDLYLHRYMTQSNYFNYENDKYISIAVERIHYDLCTGNKFFDKMESYIYDKENKKIISQNEFMKNEKIIGDDVYTSISNALDDYAEEVGESFSLQSSYDYVLYYSYDGKILVNFEIPEVRINYNALVKP